MTTPPGGVWFWEDGEHLVSTPSYQEAVDQLRSILAEKGDARSPAEVLAEYMCPRMPRGFCRGYTGPRAESSSALLDRAKPYADEPLAPANVVLSRLEVCAKCPKCRRDVCVTCRCLDEAVYGLFGNRRSALPPDRRSGVCACARTLAMVVASVRYGEGEPLWEGTPSTCWRNS